MSQLTSIKTNVQQSYSRVPNSRPPRCLLIFGKFSTHPALIPTSRLFSDFCFVRFGMVPPKHKLHENLSLNGACMVTKHISFISHIICAVSHLSLRGPWPLRLLAFSGSFGGQVPLPRPLPDDVGAWERTGRGCQL